MHIIKCWTILMAVVLCSTLNSNAQPQNQVHFINVGQAEAILLELERDAILNKRSRSRSSQVPSSTPASLPPSTSTREPISITTMEGPTQPHARTIKNAVYCTCWDSNVVVEVAKDGSLSVH